jgi:hypothetical protein
VADTTTPLLGMTIPDLDGPADESKLAANFSLLDTVAGVLAGGVLALSKADAVALEVAGTRSNAGGGGGILGDVTFDTTASAPFPVGSAALRAIARQLVTGADDLRALEAHVLRQVGDGTTSTWALELGVHTTVPGTTTSINTGIYLASGDWGQITGAVRADTGIEIVGTAGWKQAILYYDTDNVTELFKVSQTGLVTARLGARVTGVGGLLDFSALATGTIRGGSSNLVVQSADGLNNNLSVDNGGGLTVRNGVAVTAGDVNAVAGTFAKNGVALNQAMLQSMQAATVGATTTSYSTIGRAGPTTPEAAVQAPLPRAGTVRNLRLVTAGAQPASGALVVTVRKNGVATAVTLTVPINGAAGLYSDTTHSVAFAAGDLLSVEFANAASGVSAVLTGWSVTCDA